MLLALQAVSVPSFGSVVLVLKLLVALKSFQLSKKNLDVFHDNLALLMSLKAYIQIHAKSFLFPSLILILYCSIRISKVVIVPVKSLLIGTMHYSGDGDSAKANKNGVSTTRGTFSLKVKGYLITFKTTCQP